MIYDRKAFFDAVRPMFRNKRMSSEQVAGMEAILSYAETTDDDLKYLAYRLATVFHETAQAMQPVIETRQPGEKTNPSVDTAISRLEKSFAAGKLSWVKTPYWRKDADGKSWLGRGLPQVTHKSNYLNAQAKTGIPFADNPDLMLVMQNALPVMFRGMNEGWFTGKKLSDYFGENRADPYNARKIINGLESADTVAGYYHKFVDALLKAERPDVVIPPTHPDICPTCGQPWPQEPK